MNFLGLAYRSLAGNSFRSWVVALCALLITAFALVNSLVLQGAQTSLELAKERLGADILVIPAGTTSKIESALLMGITEKVWMSDGVLGQVAEVPGVKSVTPQIYMSTLKGASCCTVEDMFLIGFDPATDFTIQPWLIEHVGGGLKLGEVVGGTYVFTPEGQQNIQIYGYLVTLMANLEPTGTGLDQTMFLTMETAQDVARLSYTLAEKPLEIPEASLSAVLVRVAPGADPQAVAMEIQRQVPGVTSIASPNMFRSYQRQITQLVRGVLLTTVATLAVSIVFIGLVFSMAANARKRELGVLRALGATRGILFRTLITEAGILALTGGLTGAFLVTLAIYLFRNLIMSSLGIPFLLPSPAWLAAQVTGGLAIALGGVTLAALFPAIQVSLSEPGVIMRE
jgi:putative ABC transport system permease protein